MHDRPVPLTDRMQFSMRQCVSTVRSRGVVWLYVVGRVSGQTCCRTLVRGGETDYSRVVSPGGK